MKTNYSFRVNNLTRPDTKKRYRNFINSLQRGGQYKRIVEYVTSASRFRVYLTGEMVFITSAHRAVRCPQSRGGGVLMAPTDQSDKKSHERPTGLRLLTLRVSERCNVTLRWKWSF